MQRNCTLSYEQFFQAKKTSNKIIQSLRDCVLHKYTEYANRISCADWVFSTVYETRHDLQMASNNQHMKINFSAKSQHRKWQRQTVE